jgi:hypothetical protein
VLAWRGPPDVVGYWALQAIGAAPENLPRLADVTLDWRVASFALRRHGWHPFRRRLWSQPSWAQIQDSGRAAVAVRRPQPDGGLRSPTRYGVADWRRVDVDQLAGCGQK